MRTIGCLWTDLKHQWTKSGLAYTSEELCGHLVQEILVYKDTHDPPLSPTMKHILSTSAPVKLGTETVGAKNFQVDNNMRQQQLIADAKAKNRNKSDIDKAFQPSWAPPVDERMVGLRIIYNFKLKGNDNKNHKEIRKGEVIDYDIASEGLVEYDGMIIKLMMLYCAKNYFKKHIMMVGLLNTLLNISNKNYLKLHY